MNEEVINVETDLAELDCVWEKPDPLLDIPMHYCPGCGHSTVHKLLTEVIQELGIQGDTIGVAPVGCSVFAYNYLNFDMHGAAHGRAAAVATGIRRVLPDKYVFSYQGDGDLAAIGTSESFHAAGRGENFLVLFINNAIYGMTGGQMAPTTLPNQITSTCPAGRDTSATGMPIRMCELLATLATPSYLERVSVHNPEHIIQTKKAIRRAFQFQIEKRGFSLIEVLSTCPTNWGKTPGESTEWLSANMQPYFPLGLYKDSSKGVPSK